jgi:Putative peptidoglycan binding domain
MRNILAPSLASLAVLYVLFVLLSEHRGIPSDSRLINNSERILDVGDRLMHTIVLRRQRQSKDYPESPNTTRIMKVQHASQDDGFYSGPFDGSMRQSTRKAIRSFQESNHLNVTGTIDDDKAREFRLDFKSGGQ